MSTPNPPAFARAAFAIPDYEDAGIHDSQQGMELRDYFAAKALIVTSPGNTPEAAAKSAYYIADMMLKERVK